MPVKETEQNGNISADQLPWQPACIRRVETFRCERNRLSLGFNKLRRT